MDETIESLVRDLTQIGSLSKSEATRRILAFVAQAESRGAAKGHLEAFELIHEHFMGSKNKDVLDALETIQAELLEKFPPGDLLSRTEE